VILVNQVAFGSAKTESRIQKKGKHESMMDKIWVRFDHFAAQEQAWGKTGAWISRHSSRFEQDSNSKDDHTEEERNAAKKAAKKRDQAFADRLHAFSKTGKAPVKRDPRHQSTGAETERAEGNQKGIPMSVAPRFGYTPYARLTELQHSAMGHIGPGAYNGGQEMDSIRQRTRVTANNSAAFAMTTPRFGRKKRMDMSDGGGKKRREKDVRMKRAVDVAMFYGDVHHKDDMEMRAAGPLSPLQEHFPRGAKTAR